MLRTEFEQKVAERKELHREEEEFFTKLAEARRELSYKLNSLVNKVVNERDVQGKLINSNEGKRRVELSYQKENNVEYKELEVIVENLERSLRLTQSEIEALSSLIDFEVTFRHD